MKYRILTLSLTAILLLLAQIARAQDDSPHFSLTDLRTLQPSLASPYATLAPDGSMIAYPDVMQGLCIYYFDTATTTCISLPDTAILEVPMSLVWSPDSAMIAFNDGPLYMSDTDSDIWLFDVKAKTFTNVTDDGVSIYSTSTPPENISIDGESLWNAATSDLYFIRHSARLDSNGQKAPVLTLYRLHITKSSVEPIRELTSDIINPAIGWLTRLSISPDGAQMAIGELNFGFTESQADGVWLIDLDDGAARQGASNSALRVGLPRGYESQGLNIPAEIAWLPDDSGLAIRMVDAGFAPLFREIVVFLDPTTGHVAPLMNFRNFPLDNPYEPDADGNVPFQALPVTGMLTPDGRYYFYLTLGAGEGKVWAVSLEHPGDPLLVGTVENAFCNPTPLVISEDGVRKYLFTISVCGGE